jgi:hypothetical protein
MSFPAEAALDASADITSTIAVASALGMCLLASWFAWKFARAVGGDLGRAFKWVMAGVLIFSVTRADDLLKVSGVFARMGVDYKHALWLPHSVTVAVGWILIAIGFRRMSLAFES